MSYYVLGTDLVENKRINKILSRTGKRLFSNCKHNISQKIGEHTYIFMQDDTMR